jgi:hypothetical protein
MGTASAGPFEDRVEAVRHRWPLRADDGRLDRPHVIRRGSLRTHELPSTGLLRDHKPAGTFDMAVQIEPATLLKSAERFVMALYSDDPARGCMPGMNTHN